MVQVTVQSWIKSIKIDKIGSKQSLNMKCLSKYLSKSFKTLEAETTRHYAKDL